MHINALALYSVCFCTNSITIIIMSTHQPWPHRLNGTRKSRAINSQVVYIAPGEARLFLPMYMKVAKMVRDIAGILVPPDANQR